jgi:periplasmic divalent cation tolerance protein
MTPSSSGPTAPEFVSVASTTDSEENAHVIARTLLDAHLAACVQISSPIQSSYWWQGKLETAREWRLTIKTSGRLFPLVEAAIRRVHAYSTPQILATPIVAGNRDYLDWMNDVLTKASGSSSAR